MKLFDKIKLGWEYLQDFADINGATLMSVMTCVFIARVALSAFHKFPSITNSESAMYASAIASLAASNIGGPKQS
jgi:type II secretory pathway component PulJ